MNGDYKVSSFKKGGKVPKKQRTVLTMYYIPSLLKSTFNLKE